MAKRFAILLFLVLAAEISLAQDTLSRRQGVGLVLSGGGAKGLSHIGVIKALEENNIPIDYIGGTSIGAIIGGLYAIGYTPDQMIDLIKSKEFEAWSKGKAEIPYAAYFYKNAPDATMANITFGPIRDMTGDTVKKFQVALPTSLISSYPMDLAVVELFSPASKACGFDFDSLMVPFFCISTDINNKHQRIDRKGNLGSAIRASMSLPLVFKPVNNDGTLLYDGGIYNNFPWKEMEQFYHPALIIGAQCAIGNIHLDEDNAPSLVLGLMMDNSNYDIPEDLGLTLKGDYNKFGMMEFEKVDELVKMGYELTMQSMDEIKSRVSARTSDREVEKKRAAFRRKLQNLRFHQDITVTGSVPKGTARFIRRTIREDRRENFDFTQLRKGYYRVIQSGVVNNFYPSIVTDSTGSTAMQDDSLLHLKIRASRMFPFKVSVGGNISSSSLNQIFLGAEYLHAGMNPWRIRTTINAGRYYRGAMLGFRHDIGVKPLAYYYVNAVAHQYDYYNGNQDILRANKLPQNIQFREFFGRFGIATPISLRKNSIAMAGFDIGRSYQSSYLSDEYLSSDTPDRGNVFFFSPKVVLKKSTLNYPIYPTAGVFWTIRPRFTFAIEEYAPGTANHTAPRVKNARHRVPSLRIMGERYLQAGKYFALGASLDMVYSKKGGFSNYYTNLLAMPVYEPVPHAGTVLMEGYRANSFVGAALHPVIKFTEKIYLHATGAYFQAYRDINREKDGWRYNYSDKMPTGHWIANAALVWQSPIGPVSLSTTYYSFGEYKWYPQINIGLLLFNKKSMED
jgi:NTE family protein